MKKNKTSSASLLIIVGIVFTSVLVIGLAFYRLKSGKVLLNQSQVVLQSITPTPSEIPLTIPSGWKVYNGIGSHSGAGFPKRFQFIYPETWELSSLKNNPSLNIMINGQNVGSLIIDPGGHGGGNPLRVIRDENVDYPAGQVEITELLYTKDVVNGTFWFIGSPNNAPPQPVYGFEFRYSYSGYQELKPIFSQILKSVVLKY